MIPWPTKLSVLSLREKLPLVGSALIAGTLLVAGTLGYVEVRLSARAEAENRLASLSSELVGLLERDLEARRELEDRVASSREVLGALTTERVDTADLTLVLDSLRSDADGNLPVIVMGRDGARIFGIGSISGAPDPDPSPPLRSVRAFTPIRSLAGRNAYWQTIPVQAGEGVVGWVAQRRAIQADEGLDRLFGRNIRFRLGQLGDSIWVDFNGGLTTVSPAGVSIGQVFERTGRDEQPHLATAKRVDLTPWVVLLDMPMSQVLARPRALLTRMGLVGGLIILGSIVLVWRLSRRLTRPLVELAAAAEAVSGGDYGRCVEVDSQDEIGRLANSFNRMSRRIARSEAALRARLEEARRLAEHLAEARRAAEQAKDGAQAANRAKAEILAAISHEIRTPISAVMAYAHLLGQLGPTGSVDRQQKYLRHIEECTGMLESLTNDLLDFSCIESGKLRIDVEIGYVDEAIRFALASLEPRARRKGIVVANRCSEGARFVGDRNRVQQIIINLVTNALKFTPERGMVTVCCERRVQGPPGLEARVGRWVAIHVEDTGPGIEPDQLERIFEPFERGRLSSAGPSVGTGGAGLGLSISRHLAEMMSGTLTVESELGDGSRFTLWLPGAPQGAADQPRARRSPNGAAPPASQTYS